MAENDIEIVGMQEATEYYDEQPTLRMAEEISEELGYNMEFAPATDFRPYGDGREEVMGNAILSKHPILTSEVRSLNPEDVEYDGEPENEPRNVLKCTIETGNQKLDFFTTHLQYTPRFENSEVRKHEAKVLRDFIREADNPVILAGDFNSPTGNKDLEPIRKEMQRIEGQQPTWTVHEFEHRGWKVDNLEYRLDEIFYSGSLELKEEEVIYSEASDHLPVVAEAEI